MTSHDRKATTPAPRTRRGPRIALLVVAVVAVLVAGVVYFAVGSWRAEAACGRDDTAPAGASSWSNGWSWVPPGFTCTYEDGTVLRSLWW